MQLGLKLPNKKKNLPNRKMITIVFEGQTVLVPEKGLFGQ